MTNARLTIQALPEADQAWIRRAILRRGELQQPALVRIEAGRHRITFEYESEIRFGPAYYRARIEGPHAKGIGQFLRERFFFLNGNPYAPEHDWFAFEEITEIPAGQSLLHFFDLGSGELLSSHTEGGYGFASWRPCSEEAILHRLVDIRRLSWYAYQPRGRSTRYLITGGSSAYVSSDGQYLILLDPHAFYLALVDLGAGKLLDWKTNKDFLDLTPNPETLQVVDFDPETPRLVALLNWTRTDRVKQTAEYESSVAIDIVQTPET